MLSVIDCHIHYWDLESHRNWYEWIAHLRENSIVVNKLQRSYLPADLVRDFEEIPWARLDGCIHVQAADGPVSSEPHLETAWLLSLQSSSPHHPTAIVPYVDLESDYAEQDLQRHLDLGGLAIKGVRQLLNWDDDPNGLSRVAPRNLLADPSYVAKFGLLEQRQLVFEAHIHPHQSQDLANAACAHPGVTFVVDHCGCPVGHGDDEFKDWRQHISVLSSLQNVVVKISGLVHPFMICRKTRYTWTDAQLQRYVKAVVETFGAGKCVFGSNFPVDRPLTSYLRMLKAVVEALRACCSEAEVQNILADNARRVYRM